MSPCRWRSDSEPPPTAPPAPGPTPAHAPSGQAELAKPDPPLHQLLVRSLPRLQLTRSPGQDRLDLQILPIHLIDIALGDIEAFAATQAPAVPEVPPAANTPVGLATAPAATDWQSGHPAPEPVPAEVQGARAQPTDAAQCPGMAPGMSVTTCWPPREPMR